MILIFNFFRQVTPTEDNTAARSLPEENQRHNMKLVAVNARVTFVVWILETIANISVLSFWAFVHGTSSWGKNYNVTNAMMWHYLIISYTFLMNTSYNKNRIIEDGWKIVIMNPLKSILYRIHKLNNYFSSPNHQTDVQNILGNSSSNSTLNDQVKDSSQNPKLDRTLSSDIFVISRLEIEHFPTSHTSNFVDLTIEDLEEVVCTRSSEQAILKHELRLLSPSSSMDTEYDPYDCNRPINYRVQKGKEILSEMQRRLNNENAYIHYFRQLLEFERLFNLHLNDPIKGFRIEPFITFPTTQRSKIKNKNINNHKKQTKNTQDKSKTIAGKQSLSDQKSPEQFIRKQLRLGMLNKISSNIIDENDYNEFLNNLINLEERLIKEK